MTPIIAGATDRHPTICGVCARRAEGLAYNPTNRATGMMWICESCAPLAKEVYTMPKADLCAYEIGAVNAAAKAVTGEMIDAILTALWEAGASDLSTLSAETVEAICANPPAAVSDAVGAALVAYSKAMREAIGNSEAPF